MRMPAPGQLAFLDAVAFNYLIGNADAHAKNHSVVYRGGAPVFAPLYDLVCTAVYPELSRESAMRIGGDAAFARSMNVRLEDGSTGRFAFTLMPQWVKARWTAGVLQPSKLYHFANACLLE